MPSPFPGMDPYLEHPVLWEGVHARMVVAIANRLRAQALEGRSAGVSLRETLFRVASCQEALAERVPYRVYTTEITSAVRECP